MKKLLLLIMVIICFSGCASQQQLIVMPVKFEHGITDQQILSYAGDFKIMCAKGLYGGSTLRFASTTVGRSASIAAGLFGVAGNAGRGTLGILSILSGAAYESQSIFDAKGKAAICGYGLQRIEKAELTYAKDLLSLNTPQSGVPGNEAKEIVLDSSTNNITVVMSETTSAGLILYETILKTKEIMLDMLMGQIPEKGDL